MSFSSKVLKSPEGCQSRALAHILPDSLSFDSFTQGRFSDHPLANGKKEARKMLIRILSQLSMSLSWLCVATFIPLLLLSAPASAITESDKGTVLNLPDDAYRVPEAFLYPVKGNDNLHWLAAKFYGDARQWVRIYQANQEKVQYPSLLIIGQQLLIPAGP
jgi:hypothetical protein